MISEKRVLKGRYLYLYSQNKMKKITTKIPSWAILIAGIILTIGLTATFTRASGRFNLPLSWILSPSGVSVDLDNNGIIDNVDAGVPSGLIALFDTDCPSGWTRVSALDGKFLTGGASYNAAVGGNNSITLAETNLPSHTHGAGTLAADSAGAHSHTATPSITQLMGQSISACGWASTWNACSEVGTSILTHSHQNSVSGTFSVTNSSAGAHTHTISGLTGGTGSGTAFDNRPAFATIVICKKD